MNKLSLIGLNNDKEEMLRDLMELGAVHLEDIAPGVFEDGWEGKLYSDVGPEEVLELEEKMERISLVLKHLEKYDARKKGLFAIRRPVPRKDCERVWLGQERLWNAIDGVFRSEQHMAHLHNEKNRYSNLMASLEPWEALDIPLDMAGTETVSMLMGYIPGKSRTEELEKDLETVGACCLQILNREREHTYVYLIYHRSVGEELGRTLKQHGFTRVAFKDLEGTAGENIRQASERIQELEREYEGAAGKMAVHAEELEDLELLYDVLMIRRDRKRALMRLVGTENVFMLEGWVPAHLGECLSETFQSKWTCVAAVREPFENEEYPVLLKNSDVGRSVEAITAMYSLPNPKEIDPNFIMSLFFIFFFGLMLGDGVYGIVLILAAGFVLWKVRLEESIRKFVKLLLYCGISTVFWGALFGGWMGIPALSEYYLWMNPVERPEEFLGWSLIFGILHIYVGIGVKGANLFRQKRYLDIVLDVGIWYVFFTGFVLFVLPYVFGSATENLDGPVTAGKYMLLASALVIVATQGRGKKNILSRFFSGTAKLYDLIKFTSDVLSYSRLMALGLATSVIGFIVYEIAAMNGTDSVLGVISFVLILLIGHSLNFAIAMLSAFVHSSRLQYIEFFSRFFKGGGVAFKPLRTNTKFIQLQEGKDCGRIIFGNDR